MLKKIKKFISTAVASVMVLSMCCSLYAVDIADIPQCEIVPPYDVPSESSKLDFYNSMKAAYEKKIAAYNARRKAKASIPTSINLNLTHIQQENSYYCGPATAVMVLKYFMYAPSQSTIAGSDYLRTTTDGTPWYSGTTQTSEYYFNMVYALNKWQYEQIGRYLFGYSVYNTGSKEDYIDHIIDTLSCEFAIPLNGSAKGKMLSYLRHYTEGHWVAIEGYYNSGNYFRIVDPASGIKGFDTVPKKYDAPKSEVMDFISYGIIW